MLPENLGSGYLKTWFDQLVLSVSGAKLPPLVLNWSKGLGTGWSKDGFAKYFEFSARYYTGFD